MERKVPLHELLEGVPEGARLVIDSEDGMSTSFIPVGLYCKEAASALRQALAQEPSKQFHDWAVAEHQKALALAQPEQGNSSPNYPIIESDNQLDKIVELAIQGHASTRDAIRWAMQEEREACAKVCEEQQFIEIEDEACESYNIGCRHSAEAIRARGEK